MTGASTTMGKRSSGSMMKKLFAGLACAVLLHGLAASPAAAAPIVANGDFVGAEDSTGTLIPTPFQLAYGTYTQNFAWSGTGGLNAIAANGTQVIAHAPANPAGYTGNIYLADASPSYSTGVYLYQTLNGLSVGQLYSVNFEQAAGDYYTQADTNKPWTDTAQWVVGLGGSISYKYFGNNVYNWVLSPDAQLQSSALMNIDPNTGTSPWQTQDLTFKATSSSELLTFLAAGSGAPPFALLANVSVDPVPEPSTWVMMIVGVAGIAFGLLRRRSTAAYAA